MVEWLPSLGRGAERMIKETVCYGCAYRFKYRTEQKTTRCPICGELYVVDDIWPIEEMFKEGDE